MTVATKMYTCTTILDHDRCVVLNSLAADALLSFPDKTFDLIYTDPPFSAHTHANLGKERRHDGTEPRAKLEFPPLDKAEVQWYARQFARLCKGWIIVHSDFRMSHVWGETFEASGGSWVRTGNWVKTNPMPQMTCDRPGTGSEDIVIGHAATRNFSWNGRGHSCTWRGPRDADAAHPNQKPEWLAQAILGMFAAPGSLVLDPFVGSGTMLSAALRTSRCERETCLDTACKACAKKATELYAPPLPVGLRVVGIDGDPKWCLHAVERIKPLLVAL